MAAQQLHLIILSPAVVVLAEGRGRNMPHSISAMARSARIVNSLVLRKFAYGEF